MISISNKVIERFKLKEDEAFAEIFYTYKDVIYAFAKHKLRNKEDARDCVQEIFQKLYLNIDKFEIPKGNFNAWFITLAKNHIIDFYRKTLKEKYILDENYIDKCSYVEQKVSILEELKYVLKEDEYDILMYYIVHELTFQEIAVMMNMNKETVRRTYHRVFTTAKEYVERIRDYEG